MPEQLLPTVAMTAQQTSYGCQKNNLSFPRDGQSGPQHQLIAAADIDAALAIAKEAEFMISADDFKSSQSVELLDKDLEIVAGGWSDFKCGGPTCGLGMDCTNGDDNHPWCSNGSLPT